MDETVEIRQVAVPLISVVMPVRNGAAYLRQAIDSILAQTLRDFEMILLDDGSTDATPAILAEAAGGDARLRLLRRESRGAGLTIALGEACAAARGRFIARMDADDVAFPERLLRQATALESRPEVAVLGAAMQFLGRTGPIDRLLRHPCDPAGVRKALAQSNCIAHPTVMMRRDAYEAAGGYRPAFLHAEDYDLWLRIGERHALANLPDPLLHYRVHEGQISFAHLADQVTYALAARAAARLRGAGQADPTEGKGSISRQDLLRMGEREAVIDETILDSFIYRTDLMAALGFEAPALRSLEELARQPLAGRAARRRAAEISWARGKIDLRARRWLHGLGRVTLACLRRPAFALNLATALPRRLAGAGEGLRPGHRGAEGDGGR